MATPHNRADIDQIAKTVLMPGDPLRSKYIADHFLTDAVLVNDVRGINGFTGTWKGVPVTVMASGMGMPSIGLYSWELYNSYHVDNIIRIGTAGAFQDNMQLRDIILAQGACTNSNYINHFGVKGGFAPIADYTLLTTADKCAQAMGLNVCVGNVFSSDLFYFVGDEGTFDAWTKLGILACEMEAAALYTNAAYAHKRALCICTVTDHLYRDEHLETDERQVSLNQMIELGLNTAVEMANK